MHEVPIDALITSCLPGCPSRIKWSFDPGELPSRHYPGMPEWFTAEEGCTVFHLERLCEGDAYKSRLGELYRQLYTWEVQVDAANRRAYASIRYLNGGTLLGARFRRSILDVGEN